MQRKFGEAWHVVFEIREQTDRQTYRHTDLTIKSMSASVFNNQPVTKHGQTSMLIHLAGPYWLGPAV